MIFSKTFYVNTTGKVDAINIIHEVKRAVRESGISDGLVNVTPPAPYTAVTSLEYDPKVAKKLADFLCQLVIDSGVSVSEKKRELRPDWQMRAFLLGRSFTVPLKEGQLGLDPWQDIVLFDFEAGGRRREFIVQIVGEGGSAASGSRTQEPQSPQKGVPLGKVTQKV